MRIAVVHHWFVTKGGGERVAECIASLFPTAEIFTLVADDAGLPDSLRSRRLHTSFLQRVPLARTHHRHFMPLYPAATESLDLRGFDLVLSSDSGPVKGVRLDPGAIHICYCHSPMRYLWDGFEQYRSGMTGIISDQREDLCRREQRGTAFGHAFAAALRDEPVMDDSDTHSRPE
jgi:hypothetical protein